MRILLSILLTISPILGHAQLSTNNKVAAFNRTEGAVVYENYALNQSFDKNLVGVSTPTGGTASIVTTSGVKLFGKGSLQFAVTSTGQLTAIRSKPFPIGLNGQTCQTKFTYATPYGGAVTQSEFSYFVTNSSGTKISATATLPATFDIAGTQKSKTAVVFYPCPYNSVTPANSWVELTIEHIGSASTSIIIDEKFDMVANDIGSGVPNNVFSAKVSSAGAVTEQNEPFMGASCSKGGTGIYNCTLNAGMFGVVPNITPNIIESGVGSGCSLQSGATTTTFSVRCFITTTASLVDSAFNLKVTRSGSDFIQPAITPNQWNYAPRAYTPTFTGFGTVTNVNCTESRTGVYNNIRCTFTAGTTTATEARISLPGSNTTKSSLSTLSVAKGTSWSATTTNTGFGNNAQVTLEPSKNYFTFANPSTTTIGKALGTAFTSSSVISVDVSIEIEGWTENQNAPQLLGSVTSDSSSALRFEYAEFTGTFCTILTRQTSSSFSAGTTPATGRCVIPMTGFSQAPYCTCVAKTATGAGLGGHICEIGTGTTASSLEIATTATGGALTNYGFAVQCIGPR